jgi:hypothetical protein
MEISMQMRLLPFFLMALTALTAGSASAQTVSISNAQLGQILSHENATTNEFAVLNRDEVLLARASLPRNVKLSEELTTVKDLQALISEEETLLAIYQETKITPIVAAQNTLVAQLNELLQRKQLLASLFASPITNNQTIASQLLTILAIDHSIAADLLQKESLVFESLPADIATQIHQQYSVWAEVIQYVQIQEQLALQ